MKIKSGVCFFLAFFVSITLLSCRPMKDPVYKGMNVLSIKKIDKNESVLEIQMNYYNPNNQGLKLKKAEGNVWLNGEYLGHFNMDTTIHILANSDYSIPVNLSVDMKNVFKNAFSAMLNPEVTIKIEGNASFGKGLVFLRYLIRYEDRVNVSELFNK